VNGHCIFESAEHKYEIALASFEYANCGQKIPNSVRVPSCHNIGGAHDLVFCVFCRFWFLQHLVCMSPPGYGTVRRDYPLVSIVLSMFMAGLGLGLLACSRVALSYARASAHSACTPYAQSSFPYLRVFQYRGSVGWHYLASMQPIPARAPNGLAASMPRAAVADLVEWEPAATPNSQFAGLPEIPPAYVIHLAPEVQAMRDDRPVNEYYFLRMPCLTCVPALEWSRQRINSVYLVLSGRKSLRP